jgi:hypothetical protein
MIFSHPKLIEFLRNIKENYTVTSLNNWNGENGIILRHDVDFDLNAAYELAKIEREIGVESTFYIMCSSQMYNPISQKNQDIIKKIDNEGFEIGLHFDPSIYEDVGIKSLEIEVKKEADILSSIIKKPIHSISIHNPSVHNQFPIFSNFKNAYDEKIFSDDTYISDSMMSFKTDIFDFVKKAKNKTIQVLLHPLYYTKNGIELNEIINEFVDKYIEELDEYWKDNSHYNSIMNEKLLEYILRKQTTKK